MFSRFRSWFAKQRNRCNNCARCYYAAARPECTGSAELADAENWTPGTRQHSLPRPLFSSFWSERNINEAVEQAFLKQFLKEHGLYNKHQTIEQRRRLKQLLELEQRTLLLHSEQYNARPDDDEVMSGVHSLQLTTQSNTTSRTCSVEFHSMPFPSPDPTSDTVLSSVRSRRVSSLPALAFGAMDLPPDEVTAASHPTVAQEVQATERWERILVWKMVVQGDVPPYLETEV